MSKSLGELANYVGGQLHGNPETKISGAGTLEEAGKSDISFLANQKYEPLLKETSAGAVVVGPQAEKVRSNLIVADDPYYAFAQIVILLYGHRKHKKTGISDKAEISGTAKIGDNCDIHNFVTISDNVKIGCNCKLYPGVFVGEGSVIGNDCTVFPNVTIYENCKIGDRVILNAGVSVGQDGFGYAPHNGVHHKIPHIGKVIIEDDVEVGSGGAIERGTLSNTIIGEGSKLGDLVAIGHGTKVGPYCLLVAQVGIAGSAKLGHHCVIGGQSGIVGHINLGDMVKVAAQSGVINDVGTGSTVVGAPAIPENKAKRAYSLIEYLPEFRRKLRRIEKHLKALDAREQ